MIQAYKFTEQGMIPTPKGNWFRKEDLPELLKAMQGKIPKKKVKK